MDFNATSSIRIFFFNFLIWYVRDRELKKHWDELPDEIIDDMQQKIKLSLFILFFFSLFLLWPVMCQLYIYFFLIGHVTLRIFSTIFHQYIFFLWGDNDDWLKAALRVSSCVNCWMVGRGMRWGKVGILVAILYRSISQFAKNRNERNTLHTWYSNQAVTDCYRPYTTCTYSSLSCNSSNKRICFAIVCNLW